MQSAGSLFEPQRLRRMTANYHGLRGLMLLPLLPAIAAIFLLELFMPTTRTELHSQATTALIAIAGPILTLLIAGGLVGTVLVAGYYRRRFGRVSPTWRTRMAGGILGGLGTFCFYYALDTGLVPYSLF